MGAPATQTVTQDVDPQFKNRLLSLYGDAQDYLRDTPYTPYAGPLVAGLDPMERSAQSYLTQNLLGSDYAFTPPTRYGPFGAVPFSPTSTPWNPGTGGTQEPPFDDSSGPGDLGKDNDDPLIHPDEPLRIQAPPGEFMNPQPFPDPFGIPGSVPPPPPGIGTGVGQAENRFASNVAGDLTGFRPDMVNASTAASGMGAYMNPYQNQVIDGAISDMGRAEAMFREGGLYSKPSSTFGGDRQDVQVGEANRDFMDRAGRLSAQLRSQGFDTAAGLASQDANRGLTAGMSNQGAGLSGAGLNLNAAGMLNQFGNDAFRNVLSGAGALSAMGSGNRALSQDMINADIGQFDEARNSGLRDIGVLQSILSGMPVGMSSTTSARPNTASQIGGGLLGLLGGGLSGGLFNSFFQ